MRSSVALLVVVSFASTVTIGAAAERVEPATPKPGAEANLIPAPKPQPAPPDRCWAQDVKHCCDAVALPDAKTCNVNGQTWVCRPIRTSDPLIVTYKKAPMGWEAKENGSTATCKFKTVNCGGSAGECLEVASEELTCQAELPLGGLCDSAVTQN